MAASKLLPRRCGRPIPSLKAATTTLVLPAADGEPVTVTITGIAKGVGMIHPNMATMLSVVLTDAAAAPEVLWSVLRPAAARTWDQLSVDGDSSTNDTVFVLASGAAANAPLAAGSHGAMAFESALEAVARDLARQQAADGEGATILITASVIGAVDDADARAVARAVISSSLVKAAAHGKDPNWGRIAGAAGNATTASAAVLRGGRTGPGRGCRPRLAARTARPRPAPYLDRRSPRVRWLEKRPARLRSSGGPRGDGCPGAADRARSRAR